MAENDTYVQVQPNSTGAKVDCALLDNGNVRQTVTIGDPAQSASVAAVLDGTLATADILDVGIGSPDNAGFVAIVGDPNGDFAGVNLLEALMDDASGLGLGVRVLNQPKLGPDGGLLLTDGKRLDLSSAANTNIIIDTLGYQSIHVTTQAMTVAVVSFSNDLISWSQGLAWPILFGATGFGFSLTPQASFVVPCVGRYCRFATSTAGTAVAYLRTVSMVGPGFQSPVNISQLNGVSVATAAGGGASNAALAVGGISAPGVVAAAATTGNPLQVSGVDANSFIRRILTDQVGALVAAGWRLPLQPDTKTTNPLPAYVPPPPVKVSLTDDTPGPDTPGLLDSLRLMTAVLMSIDRRLQDLPAKIANSQIDADDFNASDSLSSIN